MLVCLAALLPLLINKIPAVGCDGTLFRLKILLTCTDTFRLTSPVVVDGLATGLVLKPIVSPRGAAELDFQTPK